MKSTLWPAIDPEERVWATFNYGKALAYGETITGVVRTVTLLQGVDATPDAVLDGAELILAEGRVLQALVGRVDGAAYRIRFKASTSSGRVLIAGGVLPVEWRA